MLPQGRGRWVVFQKRIMIHFVLGHIHYSSQVHICSDFITACAIRKQVWISSLSPPLPLAVSPVPGGVEKFYQRRQLQDRRVILRPQERCCVSSWHRCGIQVLQRWEVSGRNGCGFFKRLYCCLNLGRPYQGDTLLPYPSLSRGEKKTPTKTPGTRVLLPVCRGKHCG